jgi:hypothetical protein
MSRDIRWELEDTMSKVHVLANKAVAGETDWKSLDALYWELAKIADKMREMEN